MDIKSATKARESSNEIEGVQIKAEYNESAVLRTAAAAATAPSESGTSVAISSGGTSSSGSASVDSVSSATAAHRQSSSSGPPTKLNSKSFNDSASDVNSIEQDRTTNRSKKSLSRHLHHSKGSAGSAQSQTYGQRQYYDGGGSGGGSSSSGRTKKLQQSGQRSGGTTAIAGSVSCSTGGGTSSIIGPSSASVGTAVATAVGTVGGSVSPACSDTSSFPSRQSHAGTGGRSRSQSPSSSSGSIHSHSPKNKSSHHSSSKKEEGFAERKLLGICIRSLPLRSSDTSLRDGLFHEYKKCGKVTSVDVFDSGQKRYAIVSFRKTEDAEEAYIVSQNKMFFGTQISVERHEGIELDDSDMPPSETEMDEYHSKATRTLFIGNLEKDIAVQTLRDVFKDFGEILDIDIKYQGAVSPYGFVQYTDITSVVKALHAMEGKHIGCNRIKLGFGKSMPSPTVWIDGVSETITKEWLKTYFAHYGDVQNMYYDKIKGRALVFYNDVDQAHYAVNDIKANMATKKKIQVDYASLDCVNAFVEVMIATNQMRPSDRPVEQPSQNRHYRGSVNNSYQNRYGERYNSNVNAGPRDTDGYDAGRAPSGSFSGTYGTNSMAGNARNRTGSYSGHPSTYRTHMSGTGGGNRDRSSYSYYDGGVPPHDNGGPGHGGQGRRSNRHIDEFVSEPSADDYEQELRDYRRDRSDSHSPTLDRRRMSQCDSPFSRSTRASSPGGYTDDRHDQDKESVRSYRIYSRNCDDRGGKAHEPRSFSPANSDRSRSSLHYPSNRSVSPPTKDRHRSKETAERSPYDEYSQSSRSSAMDYEYTTVNSTTSSKDYKRTAKVDRLRESVSVASKSLPDRTLGAEVKANKIKLAAKSAKINKKPHDDGHVSDHDRTKHLLNQKRYSEGLLNLDDRMGDVDMSKSHYRLDKQHSWSASTSAVHGRDIQLEDYCDSVHGRKHGTRTVTNADSCSSDATVAASHNNTISDSGSCDSDDEAATDCNHIKDRSLHRDTGSSEQENGYYDDHCSQRVSKNPQREILRKNVGLSNLDHKHSKTLTESLKSDLQKTKDSGSMRSKLVEHKTHSSENSVPGPVPPPAPSTNKQPSHFPKGLLPAINSSNHLSDELNHDVDKPKHLCRSSSISEDKSHVVNCATNSTILRKDMDLSRTKPNKDTAPSSTSSKTDKTPTSDPRGNRDYVLKNRRHSQDSTRQDIYMMLPLPRFARNLPSPKESPKALISPKISSPQLSPAVLGNCQRGVTSPPFSPGCSRPPSPGHFATPKDPEPKAVVKGKINKTDIKSSVSTSGDTSDSDSGEVNTYDEQLKKIDEKLKTMNDNTRKANECYREKFKIKKKTDAIPAVPITTASVTLDSNKLPVVTPAMLRSRSSVFEQDSKRLCKTKNKNEPLVTGYNSELDFMRQHSGLQKSSSTESQSPTAQAYPAATIHLPMSTEGKPMSAPATTLTHPPIPLTSTSSAEPSTPLSAPPMMSSPQPAPDNKTTVASPLVSPLVSPLSKLSPIVSPSIVLANNLRKNSDSLDGSQSPPPQLTAEPELPKKDGFSSSISMQPPILTAIKKDDANNSSIVSDLQTQPVSTPSNAPSVVKDEPLTKEPISDNCFFNSGKPVIKIPRNVTPGPSILKKSPVATTPVSILSKRKSCDETVSGPQSGKSSIANNSTSSDSETSHKKHQASLTSSKPKGESLTELEMKKAKPTVKQTEKVESKISKVESKISKDSKDHGKKKHSSVSSHSKSPDKKSHHHKSDHHTHRSSEHQRSSDHKSTEHKSEHHKSEDQVKKSEKSSKHVSSSSSRSKEGTCEKAKDDHVRHKDNHRDSNKTKDSRHHSSHSSGEKISDRDKKNILVKSKSSDGKNKSKDCDSDDDISKFKHKNERHKNHADGRHRTIEKSKSEDSSHSTKSSMSDVGNSDKLLHHRSNSISTASSNSKKSSKHTSSSLKDRNDKKSKTAQKDTSKEHRESSSKQKSSTNRTKKEEERTSKKTSEKKEGKDSSGHRKKSSNVSDSSKNEECREVKELKESNAIGTTSTSDINEEELAMLAPFMSMYDMVKRRSSTLKNRQQQDQAQQAAKRANEHKKAQSVRQRRASKISSVDSSSDTDDSIDRASSRKPLQQRKTTKTLKYSSSSSSDDSSSDESVAKCSGLKQTLPHHHSDQDDDAVKKTPAAKLAKHKAKKIFSSSSSSEDESPPQLVQMKKEDKLKKGEKSKFAPKVQPKECSKLQGRGHTIYSDTDSDEEPLVMKKPAKLKSTKKKSVLDDDSNDEITCSKNIKKHQAKIKPLKALVMEYEEDSPLPSPHVCSQTEIEKLDKTNESTSFSTSVSKKKKPNVLKNVEFSHKDIDVKSKEPKKKKAAGPPHDDKNSAKPKSKKMKKSKDKALKDTTSKDIYAFNDDSPTNILKTDTTVQDSPAKKDQSGLDSSSQAKTSLGGSCEKLHEVPDSNKKKKKKLKKKKHTDVDKESTRGDNIFEMMVRGDDMKASMNMKKDDASTTIIDGIVPLEHELTLAESHVHLENEIKDEMANMQEMGFDHTAYENDIALAEVKLENQVLDKVFHETEVETTEEIVGVMPDTDRLIQDSERASDTENTYLEQQDRAISSILPDKSPEIRSTSRASVVSGLGTIESSDIKKEDSAEVVPETDQLALEADQAAQSLLCEPSPTDAIDEGNQAAQSLLENEPVFEGLLEKTDSATNQHTLSAEALLQAGCAGVQPGFVTDISDKEKHVSVGGTSFDVEDEATKDLIPINSSDTSESKGKIKKLGDLFSSSNAAPSASNENDDSHEPKDSGFSSTKPDIDETVMSVLKAKCLNIGTASDESHSSQEEDKSDDNLPDLHIEVEPKSKKQESCNESSNLSISRPTDFCEDDSSMNSKTEQAASHNISPQLSQKLYTYDQDDDDDDDDGLVIDEGCADTPDNTAFTHHNNNNDVSSNVSTKDETAETISHASEPMDPVHTEDFPKPVEDPGRQTMRRVKSNRRKDDETSDNLAQAKVKGTLDNAEDKDEHPPLITTIRTRKLSLKDEDASPAKRAKRTEDDNDKGRRTRAATSASIGQRPRRTSGRYKESENSDKESVQEDEDDTISVRRRMPRRKVQQRRPGLRGSDRETDLSESELKDEDETSKNEEYDIDNIQKTPRRGRRPRKAKENSTPKPSVSSPRSKPTEIPISLATAGTVPVSKPSDPVVKLEKLQLHEQSEKHDKDDSLQSVADKSKHVGLGTRWTPPGVIKGPRKSTDGKKDKDIFDWEDDEDDKPLPDLHKRPRKRAATMDSQKKHDSEDVCGDDVKRIKTETSNAPESPKTEPITEPPVTETTDAIDFEKAAELDTFKEEHLAIKGTELVKPPAVTSTAIVNSTSVILTSVTTVTTATSTSVTTTTSLAPATSKSTDKTILQDDQISKSSETQVVSSDSGLASTIAGMLRPSTQHPTPRHSHHHPKVQHNPLTTMSSTMSNMERVIDQVAKGGYGMLDDSIHYKQDRRPRSRSRDDAPLIGGSLVPQPAPVHTKHRGSAPTPATQSSQQNMMPTPRPGIPITTPQHIQSQRMALSTPRISPPHSQHPHTQIPGNAVPPAPIILSQGHPRNIHLKQGSPSNLGSPHHGTVPDVKALDKVPNSQGVPIPGYLHGQPLGNRAVAPSHPTNTEHNPRFKSNILPHSAAPTATGARQDGTYGTTSQVSAAVLGSKTTTTTANKQAQNSSELRAALAQPPKLGQQESAMHRQHVTPTVSSAVIRPPVTSTDKQSTTSTITSMGQHRLPIVFPDQRSATSRAEPKASRHTNQLPLSSDSKSDLRTAATATSAAAPIPSSSDVRISASDSVVPPPQSQIYDINLGHASGNMLYQMPSRLPVVDPFIQNPVAFVAHQHAALHAAAAAGEYNLAGGRPPSRPPASQPSPRGATPTPSGQPSPAIVQPHHIPPSASHIPHPAALPPHMQPPHIVRPAPPPPQHIPPDASVSLVARYPVVWQGRLALKNDSANVQMHFLSGNKGMIKLTLPQMSQDGNLNPLRIAQRMRLEQTQLDSVAKHMANEDDYCMLVAIPCGLDQNDVTNQTRALDESFLKYLQQKSAAGIANIPGPNSNTAAYVVHVFPPCGFTQQNLQRAPDLLANIQDIAYLLIVIANC